MHYRLPALLIHLTRMLGLRWPVCWGRCAYCGQADQLLYETTGPLGRGGVFVCDPCERSCLALIRKTS